MMNRKVWSVLLALCLCLCLLPINAGAAELMAEDGAALAEVVAKAGEGDTVKLAADFELSETIVIDKGINLDLNGHKISGDIAELLVIDEGVTDVTILDSSADQNGMITSSAAGAKVVHVQKSGGLRLESGSIRAEAANGYGVYTEFQSNFEMYGGLVGSEYRAVYLGKTSTFKMVSGEITAKTSAVYFGDMGISIVVSGGSVSGSTAIYTANNMSTKITIEGGTFTGTTNAITHTGTAAKLVINGGTFNGKINSTKTVASISGGRFSDTTNIATYLAANRMLSHEANEQGYYEVVLLDDSDAEAQVGSGANAKKYPTLQQAISAATSGETVTLLKSANLAASITVTKSITLDLAGNDVTLSGVSGVAGDVFTVYNGGKFTVIGQGTIETKDGDVAIRVGTSSTQTVLSIGEDVTVKGGTAVLIQPPSASSDPATYTASVTVKGKLVGEGSGLNIQGQLVKGKVTVAVENGAQISGATGIYAAGNGDITIKGGEITGTATGIEIRSGELTVEAGTIQSTADSFSVTSNGSGGTTKGAGIAVSQHTTQRPITVNVSGGTVRGYVGLSIADPEKNAMAESISIEVEGGDFIASQQGEDSASVHVAGDYGVSGFVTGGNFSDSLMDTGYLESSLQAELKSAAKNPDAPFSYHKTMTEALNEAQDGDTVTHIESMESKETTVPITFRSGYDDISIVVYVEPSATYTLPENEYFDYAGHVFSGWSDGTDTYQAGDRLTLPAEGLTLTALWDKADKRALKAAVEEALALIESEYTADSWAALESALKNAQLLLAEEEATQAQVDAATEVLKSAIAALVKAEGTEPVPEQPESVPEQPAESEETPPSEVPQTGERDRLTGWIMAACLSMAAALTALQRRKSAKAEKDAK